MNARQKKVRDMLTKNGEVNYVAMDNQCPPGVQRWRHRVATNVAYTRV